MKIVTMVSKRTKIKGSNHLFCAILQQGFESNYIRMISHLLRGNGFRERLREDSQGQVLGNIKVACKDEKKIDSNGVEEIKSWQKNF